MSVFTRLCGFSAAWKCVMTADEGHSVDAFIKGITDTQINSHDR